MDVIVKKGGYYLKFYITRHGETEWNKAGKMQGWKNSSLTEKGAANAKTLGRSLKHIEFDCIYCSPLGRAVETANHIRGDKTTEIVFWEDLKEMGFGVWEGLRHEEIEEMYPDEHYNFWNKPHLYSSIEGESYQELIDRVRKALEDIVKDAKGENILIVAHAAVIKAIFTIIKKHSLEEFWKPPYMHDTCLSIIEATNDELSFILEADVSHLE